MKGDGGGGLVEKSRERDWQDDGRYILDACVCMRENEIRAKLYHHPWDL